MYSMNRTKKNSTATLNLLVSSLLIVCMGVSPTVALTQPPQTSVMMAPILKVNNETTAARSSLMFIECSNTKVDTEITIDISFVATVIAGDTNVPPPGTAFHLIRASNCVFTEGITITGDVPTSILQEMVSWRYIAMFSECSFQKTLRVSSTSTLSRLEVHNSHFETLGTLQLNTVSFIDQDPLPPQTDGNASTTSSTALPFVRGVWVRNVSLPPPTAITGYFLISLVKVTCTAANTRLIFDEISLRRKLTTTNSKSSHAINFDTLRLLANTSLAINNMIDEASSSTWSGISRIHMGIKEISGGATVLLRNISTPYSSLMFHTAAMKEDSVFMMDQIYLMSITFANIFVSNSSVMLLNSVLKSWSATAIVIDTSYFYGGDASLCMTNVAVSAKGSALQFTSNAFMRTTKYGFTTQCCNVKVHHFQHFYQNIAFNKGAMLNLHNTTFTSTDSFTITSSSTRRTQNTCCRWYDNTREAHFVDAKVVMVNARFSKGFDFLATNTDFLLGNGTQLPSSYSGISNTWVGATNKLYFSIETQVQLGAPIQGRYTVQGDASAEEINNVFYRSKTVVEDGATSETAVATFGGCNMQSSIALFERITAVPQAASTPSPTLLQTRTTSGEASHSTSLSPTASPSSVPTATPSGRSTSASLSSSRELTSSGGSKTLSGVSFSGTRTGSLSPEHELAESPTPVPEKLLVDRTTARSVVVSVVKFKTAADAIETTTTATATASTLAVGSPTSVANAVRIAGIIKVADCHFNRDDVEELSILEHPFAPFIQKDENDPLKIYVINAVCTTIAFVLLPSALLALAVVRSPPPPPLREDRSSSSPSSSSDDSGDDSSDDISTDSDVSTAHSTRSTKLFSSSKHRRYRKIITILGTVCSITMAYFVPTSLGAVTMILSHSGHVSQGSLVVTVLLLLIDLTAFGIVAFELSSRFPLFVVVNEIGRKKAVAKKNKTTAIENAEDEESLLRLQSDDSSSTVSSRTPSSSDASASSSSVDNPYTFRNNPHPTTTRRTIRTELRPMHFVEAFLPWFDGSRSPQQLRIRLFAVEDVSIAAGVAVLSSIEPEDYTTSCATVYLPIAALLVAHFIYLVYYRPYWSRFEFHFALFHSVLQLMMIGVVASISGQRQDRNPRAVTALGWLTLIESSVYFVQCFVLAAQAYLRSQRRQAELLQREQTMPVDPVLVAGLTHSVNSNHESDSSSDELLVVPGDAASWQPEPAEEMSATAIEWSTEAVNPLLARKSITSKERSKERK